MYVRLGLADFRIPTPTRRTINMPDFLDSLLLCKVFLTELLEVIKSVEKTDVENSSFDDGRELTGTKY